MKTNFQYFFLLLLTFSLYSNSFSQRTCQTSETEYYLKNKDKLVGSETFEKKIQQVKSNIAKQKRRKKTLSNGLVTFDEMQRTESTYQIPIIIHVVHNGEPIGEGSNISAAQIYGQIEVLNEDFNFENPNRDETLDDFKDIVGNPSIEFVAATIDPNGIPLPEPGISRSKGCLKQWDSATFDNFAKPTTVWNPSIYFNIWVTNLRRGAYGYAQFPTLSDLDGIRDEAKGGDTDGVVVNYRNFGTIEKTPNIQSLIDAAPLNRGRTATHEVGHYFGLLHVWGLLESCSVDDFCEDTPNKSRPQRECDLNESSCESDQIAIVQNFMDYTHDECMTLFTEDQVERMHAVLSVSPRRRTLLTSNVAEPITNRVFSIFETSKQRVIEGGEVRFIDKSLATGNKQINTYQWIFEGGVPSTSSERNPIVTYSNEGSFMATLKVSSGDGTESTKSVQVEVIENNFTALDQTVLNFEDRNFQADGWSFERSDITNWRLFSNGAYEASDFSVFASNFNYRSCETDLSFTSPFINIPSNRTLEVRFDVAYGFNENNLPDSLEVAYTTDGGDKLITLWKKGGKELRTAINQASNFTPLASQWQSHKLYIEIDDESNFIQVKFRNIGGNNNNLYLDNLGVRQVTDLQPPIINFDVNYPLILLSETAHFYSNTDFGVNFNWAITGTTNLQKTGRSPQLIFTQTGTYDVTLQASNRLGTRENTEENAIEVIEGRKITNIDSKRLIDEIINDKPLAGHDGQNTVSKAEFFNDLGARNKMHAVDIFFADAKITNLDATFDVVIWSVDENGQPNEELYRQNVSYSLINRDIFDRRQFTRVVFDEAQSIPSDFFVSVELEYESGNTFSIFTEKKQEGKGWERKADDTWVSYETNRGQNYSNSISVVLSSDGVLGVDDSLNEFVNLYPNPNDGNFSLETQNLKVESINIYNSIGQVVYKKDIPNTFISEFNIDLKKPLNGMYIVRIQTQKGVITRKLIIQN